MKTRSIIVALGIALLCGGTALAQTGRVPKKETPKKVDPNAPATVPGTGDGKDTQPEAELKVGDKAPAITVDSFIKGEEVKSFEAGKVYVVEFWATWCGPCVAAIPHLTELQHKHKDVVFTGVAASERAPKTGQPDNRLENVKKFVNDKGTQMDYRVAYDSKSAMWKSWMTPAGRGGIPCTFIVDGEGKIAYIGHPMQMEQPLEDLLAKIKADKDKKDTTPSTTPTTPPTDPKNKKNNKPK
jgi:thiol-disulfide isomerase/thioredoxin